MRQTNGTIVLVAGDAGGSYCQFPIVTAFNVGVDGAAGSDFSSQLVAPNSAFGQVELAGRDDGRLLYAAVTVYGGSRGLLVQQLGADGAPDMSFGTTGKILYVLPANEDPYYFALQLLPGGDAIVALKMPNALQLYKIDSRGRPVATFGAGGAFVYPVDTAGAGGMTYRGLSLQAQADGSLLLGTSAIPVTPPETGEKNETLFVLRVSADGKLTAAQHLLPDTASSYWGTLALPDNSALILRSRQMDGVNSYALYRLLPDNTFDSRYGPGGAFRLPATRGVSGMAIDSSGRLLVAGLDASSAFLARYDLDGGAAVVSPSTPVVEFYNTALQHYFVTAGPGEIAAVEAGAAGEGWKRTGGEFRAYLPESGIPVDALPVCRFYGTPGRGPNSHFYTVNPRECALVKNDPGWLYEGIAFYLHAPVFGQCRAGQQAVYRVYNNRFAQNDSNHRYITDGILYAQMRARGWVAEGVVFCGASR